MTIIGMKLGAISFKTLFSSGKLYYVSLLKLVVFPVVVTAAMFAVKLIPVNADWESIILGVFVAFSMPTAGLAATFADEFGWERKKGTIVMTLIIIVLGSASALGFNVLSFVSVIGMGILDFFDFLTNSLMMPVAAFATCIFVVKAVGLDNISKEVKLSSKFRFEGMYRVFIRSVAPIFVVVILLSSILSVLGILNI
jgi:NSS family neurotransmitter:Na+ symporter